MHELFLIPAPVEAGRELSLSARHDAPVIDDRPRRRRPPLRELAGRLAAPRPRLQTARLETE